MGMDVSPDRAHRRARAAARRARSTAAAGPVTVTRRDGTVEVRPAYDPAAARRVVDGDVP